MGCLLKAAICSPFYAFFILMSAFCPCARGISEEKATALEACVYNGLYKNVSKLFIGAGTVANPGPGINNFVTALECAPGTHIGCTGGSRYYLPAVRTNSWFAIRSDISVGFLEFRCGTGAEVMKMCICTDATHCYRPKNPDTAAILAPYCENDQCSTYMYIQPTGLSDAVGFVPSGNCTGCQPLNYVDQFHTMIGNPFDAYPIGGSYAYTKISSISCTGCPVLDTCTPP